MEQIFDPSVAVSGTRRKLLVVEDSGDLRRMLAVAFSEYETLTAENGEAALALANTALPDVFLLDVGMPVLDGIETCRRIRRDPKLRGSVVIMLTGRSSEEDRQKGLQAGADAYVTKPFSPMNLRRLVQDKIKSRQVPSNYWSETAASVTLMTLGRMITWPLLIIAVVTSVMAYLK